MMNKLVSMFVPTFQEIWQVPASHDSCLVKATTEVGPATFSSASTNGVKPLVPRDDAFTRVVRCGSFFI